MGRWRQPVKVTRDSFCLCLLLLFCQTLGVTGAPPAFEERLYVTTLYEREKDQKPLMPLNCTDDDSTPVVSLGSVTPSYPCGSCFSVLPDSSTDAFNLIFTPDGGELTTQDTYYIQVVCTAGGDQVSQVVEVRLTRNTPPQFDPDQNYAFKTVNNAKDKKAGDVVYNLISAIDNDNDTIYFSMTSDPASDNFEIGPGDGVIRAKNDLKYECSNQITFKVMITDHINEPVGPLSVHVTLQDSAQAPEISNLDVSVQVPEDTAVSDPIIALKTSTNGLDYVITADPPANLDFFDINSDKVKVKNTLDFETAPSNRATNLTIMAFDGSCWSQPHYLHVTVTDVNEPPSIHPQNAHYTVYEGSDLSAQLTIPWQILDEDFSDNHTFRIVDNQQNFSIDPLTGQLSVNVDWDVDKVDNPQPQTLTIEVTDKGGLTDQTQVTLYFKDRNDNTPVIEDEDFTFAVCETSRKIGAKLGQMVCTDGDSPFQGNNKTYFTGGSGSLTVTADGWIIMSSRPALGQTLTTTAYCHDQGLWPGPLTSTPTYISLTGTECTPDPKPVDTTQPATASAATTATTTTTTTTTTSAATSNDGSWLDENLWWVVVAGLLGALLLGLLLYMWLVYCWRYCSQCWQRQWCYRQPPQPRRLRAPPRLRTPPPPRVRTPPRKVAPVEQPKPPTPPPTPPPAIVGPQDAYIYDFWKERYPDDDYANEPERQHNPRPVTPENKPSGGVNHNHEPGKNGPIVPSKTGAAASKSPKSCVIM